MLTLERGAPLPQRRGATSDGSLHWDVLRHAPRGAAPACARRPRAGPVHGIGIDSWAVDYGLLDAGGALLGNPVLLPRRPHRRRRRAGARARSARAELYAVTGLQQLPFNTIYQLVAAPAPRALEQAVDAAAAARPARLLAHRPDRCRAHQRLHHRAATTCARGRGPPTWPSGSACPSAILPPLRAAGRPGRHAAARRRRGGRAGPDVPVVAVGSHDTASAVVGVPAERRAVGVHLLGDVVAGRPRARRAGAHRGGAAGRLHQRGRRRRHRSGSSRT